MAEEKDVEMLEILNPGKEDITTFHKIKNRHIRVKAGMGVISKEDAVLFAEWLEANKCLVGDDIEAFEDRAARLDHGFRSALDLSREKDERENAKDPAVRQVSAGVAEMAKGNKASKGGRKSRSSGDPGNPDSKHEGEAGDINDVNAGNVDDNLRRPMSSESFENGNPNPDSEQGKENEENH